MQSVQSENRFLNANPFRKRYAAFGNEQETPANSARLADAYSFSLMSADRRLETALTMTMWRAASTFRFFDSKSPPEQLSCKCSSNLSKRSDFLYLPQKNA